VRLLRPGGMLAVNRALAGGRVGDPSARDADTVALREVVKAMRESDDWTPALLPVGDGLLCAVRR
jgi:predicted O-methyltransferase YrrM